MQFTIKYSAGITWNYVITSNSVLPNSLIPNQNSWNYFSLSYSVLLNRADNCDSTISDEFKCATRTIDANVKYYPILNLAF